MDTQALWWLLFCICVLSWNTPAAQMLGQCDTACQFQQQSELAALYNSSGAMHAAKTARDCVPAAPQPRQLQKP